MRKLIVIPARYASSRLPGKPLLRETGKYMVEHVYERAWQSKLADRVIVATDDDRIEVEAAEQEEAKAEAARQQAKSRRKGRKPDPS